MDLVAVRLGDALPVAEGEGVRARDALRDGVVVLVTVRLAVGRLVRDLLGEAPVERVVVALGVGLKVEAEVELRLGVGEKDGVRLGLEPLDKELVRLGVPERVGLQVLVRVLDTVGERVTEEDASNRQPRRSRICITTGPRSLKIIFFIF